MVIGIPPFLSDGSHWGGGGVCEDRGCYNWGGGGSLVGGGSVFQGAVR